MIVNNVVLTEEDVRVEDPLDKKHSMPDGRQRQQDSRPLKPLPLLSLPQSASNVRQDVTEGILICLDDTDSSFPSTFNKYSNGENSHSTRDADDEDEKSDVVEARPCKSIQLALSDQEEKATQDFLERVNNKRLSYGNSPLPWTAGVKFLMARKFNVQRALELYEQHHAVRLQNKLTKLDPKSDPLRSELLSGKFTVLPTRDQGGAAIAVFTARFHQPSVVPHDQTLQGLVYQLDAALEDPETQRSGLVFIYDMSESKYSNFDYELSTKILTLLKGGYPARLKKVLIVTAPLWFRAPFKILRLFVREKLRDRVFTVSIPQLLSHIPSSSLPQSLGGVVDVNHQNWLLHCYQILGGTPDLWGITLVDSFKGDMANCGGPSKEQPSGTASETELQSINKDYKNVFTKKIRRHGQSTPSPVQNSSGSSGFSDDDNLPFEERTGLTILEFLEHLKQKGRRGLLDEYAEILSKSPDGTFEASSRRANISRNRYSDVLCFDRTRVILSTDGDAEGSNDYINANFVDGYKQKNAFISTQGPLPKTFGDFWKMVWEQKVVTITMTTRVVERGRTKCGQYWPPDKSTSVTHEGYKLENQEVETTPDFAISRLRLTNTKTNESRNITHLLFLSWPDYGVPSSAAAMLNFLNIIKEEQAASVKSLGKAWEGHPLGPPILVHCSAGIGRTGTLCTIDTCIRRLDDQGVIDVQGTVVRIRSQRAHSIQVPEQYLFCHAAVIEYARGKNLITDVDVEGVPDLLLEGDSDSE